MGREIPKYRLKAMKLLLEIVSQNLALLGLSKLTFDVLKHLTVVYERDHLSILSTGLDYHIYIRVSEGCFRVLNVNGSTVYANHPIELPKRQFTKLRASIETIGSRASTRDSRLKKFKFELNRGYLEATAYNGDSKIWYK